MSKVKKYHEQSDADLQATLLQERHQLFRLVNKKKTDRELSKPHRIPQTKKNIARLLTILHARQLAQKQGQGA